MNIIQPVEDPVNRVRGERKDVRSCETETLEIVNVASGHKVLQIVVIEEVRHIHVDVKSLEVTDT